MKMVLSPSPCLASPSAFPIYIHLLRFIAFAVCFNEYVKSVCMHNSIIFSSMMLNCLYTIAVYNCLYTIVVYNCLYTIAVYNCLYTKLIFIFLCLQSTVYTYEFVNHMTIKHQQVINFLWIRSLTTRAQAINTHIFVSLSFRYTASLLSHRSYHRPPRFPSRSPLFRHNRL